MIGLMQLVDYGCVDYTSADKNLITIISATKLETSMFWRASYLGRSLLRIPEVMRPKTRIFSKNVSPNVWGLSSLYNKAINESHDDDVLVFIHDDVYINDWFFINRIFESLAVFDIVGVAGSSSPDFKEPSWALKFNELLYPEGWQLKNTPVGVVNHFDYNSVIGKYKLS